MTARGVDFRNGWIEENVPAMPMKGDAIIGILAQRLKDDSRAAGFTVADLEIENSQVEQFMRAIITQVAEQGIDRYVFSVEPMLD